MSVFGKRDTATANMEVVPKWVYMVAVRAA
jgi:hypothetical protein